uniref:Ubiquitin-like protease family profile domain-containing protein n=1 Tax=Brassica campestris TaxID=3711 RepID=A0A3P5YUC8_BRACM|nr:unnamed protein product [Brassica rapa]
MVSQLNAAGISGRRRRANTPKPKPVSRSKKTKRYPVSDSDDDKTNSSMDSTAPTSPPVDAVDGGSSTKFPKRLFAPGFYPMKLRLNIYSKANVIASVASALKGSSAMDRLLCSQFGKLFRLPAARCPNSTKLIGSLLCRQLITIRKYVWFTFDSETEVNEPGSMWKRLFDTMRWLTEFCVVLIKHSSSPLTLQLLAFEAVPQLLARIPDADNTDDFLDNPSCCGNTVVILSTNDIVAVEGESDVIVEFSLVAEADRHFLLDEVEDTNVTRVVDHIQVIHLELKISKVETDLKSWIQLQFQNFKNGIYERLDQFEKTLCNHFGVPLPNIHNKGKRKVEEDDHGYSGSPRRTSIKSTGQIGNDTYIGEKAVDVKWDEANPHAYNSVKEVTAGERPSSAPNPESGSYFASTGSEDNVGHVSTNLSGQKTQAPVIEGGVPDSMAVQNPTSPVEKDENYESCKENISFDSQLQGKRPRAVEDMPGSETDEDDNYVESGGKRVPKKSQKIRGVYSPDARLKGLFMSEKKAEYRPLSKTNRAIFKKFNDILSENVEQQFAIKTNHIVTNSFFLDIATPGNWLSDEALYLFSPPIIKRFEAKDKLHFDWGRNIASYVTGMCRGKNLKLQLGRDIDAAFIVTIFDSFITANPTETHVDAHMTPILKSLPYILEQYVGFTDYLIKEGERNYSWNRFQGIYHNNRGGDCGPCAAKFKEMHSNGDGKEEMSRITDKSVDKFREQYAMDCYEEFVGDFQVANEAGMK